MSMDGEMWTREAGDLRDVLPRAADWDYDEDGHAEIVVGDNDLVFVGAPEEDADLPADIAAIASDQRFRVDYTIEPIGAGPEARELVVEVVVAVTRAWDGVAFHPRTGRPIVWK
jgi:hypothetical protein